MSNLVLKVCLPKPKMKPRIELICLAKCLLLLNWIQETCSGDTGAERLRAELQLDDLELVDNCENIANAKKTAYLHRNYEDKITREEAYGSMIRAHYDVLREFEAIPTELERNVTFQVKPGDGLLPEDQWNKLIEYKNRIDRIANHMKWQLNASDLSEVGTNDYETSLRISRVAANHNSTWTGRQEIYNVSDINAFANHLQLVKAAATSNGFDTVREYWETLTEFQGAYAQADQFWDEISPFYNRLLGFVKARLFQFYNISSDTSEIPVYLLGFPLGSDWSNIADIILPHPQLHYDAESYLRYKDVKDIYKYSENAVKSMGLGGLGDKFWEASDFGAPACGPEIFEFCDAEYTEISECNNSTWTVYLDAHETAARIALNNMDYRGLTRHKLRYSSVDEAVETLGSLLAINSLPYNGIVSEDSFNSDDNPANMTKLLLTALRIMPRLSYYVMADKWRLEEIELNDTSIVERYWKYRKEYTGLTGVTNKEPEYLEDTHILANKPYISKFLGTLVAFQLFEYYQDRSDNLTKIVEEFGNDGTFKDMLKERHTTDWPYLLSLHYGLEVGSAELLKHFEPLEAYFEDAPEKQVSIITSTTTTARTTTKGTSQPVAISKVVADKDQANTNLDSVVLSDEPKGNSTNNGGANRDSVPIEDSHVAMWVGVSLVVLVGCVLISGYGYKMLRKKRRTNNRRFDS